MEAFVALADPVRVGIVEILARRGELSAGEIGENFSISAPAISQHLKVLRESEVVLMKKQAQRRLYSINGQKFEEIENWAQQMRVFWDKRLDTLESLLKGEK